MIDLGTLRCIHKNRVIDEFVLGGRTPLKPNHPHPGPLAKNAHHRTRGKNPVTPWRQLAAKVLRGHDGLYAIGKVPDVLRMVKSVGAFQAVVHHGLGKGQERLVG